MDKGKEFSFCNQTNKEFSTCAWILGESDFENSLNNSSNWPILVAFFFPILSWQLPSRKFMSQIHKVNSIRIFEQFNERIQKPLDAFWDFLFFERVPIIEKLERLQVPFSRLQFFRRTKDSLLQRRRIPEERKATPRPSFSLGSCFSGMQQVARHPSKAVFSKGVPKFWLGKKSERKNAPPHVERIYLMDPRRVQRATKKKPAKEEKREIDVREASRYPGMKAVKAAGVILFKKDDSPKGKSFLLMKHPDRSSIFFFLSFFFPLSFFHCLLKLQSRWDLPKGHKEKGESDVMTALRFVPLFFFLFSFLLHWLPTRLHAEKWRKKLAFQKPK
jgi:hypothetical protein